MVVNLVIDKFYMLLFELVIKFDLNFVFCKDKD